MERASYLSLQSAFDLKGDEPFPIEETVGPHLIGPNLCFLTVAREASRGPSRSVVRTNTNIVPVVIVIKSNLFCTPWG